MKEYISQLKSYDFYSEFKPGYYLDAIDEHRWKVGQIKQITKYGLRTTIEVRFDGFGLRYDERYDLPSSSKLAPFRTHTLPYTGPQQVRRDDQIPRCAALLKEFQSIVNSTKHPQSIKPTYVNQLIRGDMFIAADFIITKRSFESNFAEANNFLISYIKEGSKLINICSEYLKELEKDNFDASLFNVHPKIALVLSLTEILFILNSIVGNKDNRCEIQRNYEKWISPQANFGKKVKEWIIEYNILNVCDRIMDFKAVNGRSLPWSLKKEACLLLSYLRDGYALPTPTDHREIIEILDYMSYFCHKGLIAREDEEKKSLALIISLIISGNFEGRLRGLNELKKILDFYYKKKDQIIAKIQQTELVAFLIDNKNFNPEIFKRSLPLFSFCFANKLMGKKELSQILTLHKDKHELQLKGFYSVLAQFPSFLDADTAISYFKEITSLPMNEMLITLIKEYTITAITKNTTFRQSYSREGAEFGLTYYWNLITSEKNEVERELKYKMVQAFASLLGDVYYTKEVQKFISLALKGIANRKNLEFYFKIIHETLKLSKSSRIAKNVQAIQKEVNIVDCIIEGLKNTQVLSDKIWECMFEFLGEVTYVSRKKLSYSQIKDFWNIKQCRPFLLSLLRKYRIKGQQDKSQQKIINKQLPFETIKEVITKIFTDFKEMENYETMTSEMYQTADQLIIAYNHNAKFIDYNYKHTIRVKALESIYGTDFYLNIINNCRQNDIVQKSIHRFIEFYMRSKDNRNLEAMKLTSWNFILEKLSKLKRHILLSYRILLEDLNGRMKSLNILQPDLVQLVVLNKATGVKKLMSVPRYTSLWKFRFLIGEEFNIPGLSFDMQLGSQFSDTSFEKQQDFSMALIVISKDSYSVIINPTKNRHPHLQTLDAFYKSFAQLKGEELYEWLGKQQESKQALQILNKLPFVKRIQQRILKLSFKQMSEIIDSTSMYRLSYQLKIITGEKNPKFISALIEKGFIPYISKIFVNKDSFKLPQYYPILSILMAFFSDLVKFAKLIKNAQLFSESFLSELLHVNKLQYPEYYDYLAKCFLFLKDISCNKDIIGLFNIKPGVVIESKQFEAVLESIALNKSKEKLSQNIVDFAKQTNNEQLLLQLSGRLLNSDKLVEKQKSCGNLFDIISLLIEKKMPPFIVESVKSLSQIIKAKAIMEDNEETENELLIGYLTLILKIVRSKISSEVLEDIIGQKKQKYFNFIINQCLFNLEQPTNIRFKTSTLRSLAYQVISEFQYSQIGSKLSQAIYKALRMSASWRKQDEWQIAPTKQVTHKYSGLKNLAATCYINSLLQQLFFIDTFRDELIGIDANTIDDKENIVLQLQNIFAHLRYSQSPVYTTSSLCKKFILDGQPIDPRVQTDVDQFFHSLMDKLQRNLSKINKKDIINNLFGGELSNLIVGSACDHASERIQPFLSIRLQIKQKKSLEEALKDFIRGEVLQGDNAYFCEKCDAKVKAVKRVCLKTLPEILIVTLKRFEFDYQTMEKFKLNSYCSFPNIVNVFPFTRDGIQNQSDADKTLYEYRLKGVVIHYGVSEAGHYTSYIQTEPQKWQYFDDQKITEFNSQQLGSQCFGGIQENPFGDDQQKKKNAYLLFYEKIRKSSPKKAIDLTDAPIMKEIKEQNMRIKLVNLLFQPNIENYILKLGAKNVDPKIFFMYFHLVFLRNQKRRQKLQTQYFCAQTLLKSKQLSTWYLNQINESFLYEFLFYSEPQIRMIISSLIIEAFKQCDNFDTGIGVLDQLCAFIGRRNLVPTYKIISNAIKIRKKEYQGHLKSINLSEMVLLAIKNYASKEQKTSPKQAEMQLRLKKTDNYFGYATCPYSERPLIDQIDLLQCIDTFKVNLNIEDLDSLVKRAKRQKTQQSMAAIIAKRYCQLEHFGRLQAIISEALSSQEINNQQEHVLTFYITLCEQCVLLKDQYTPKRIQRLALIYLKAISNNLSGYKAELMLLLGLFKICSESAAFRDKISDQFQEKDGKNLLKNIKMWVKDASSNLSNLIRMGKWGYWRRPQQKQLPYRLLSSYLESEDKINVQKILASFNAIVDKHNSFLGSLSAQIAKDETVKYQGQKYQLLKQYGLLAEIESNDKKRIVLYDDLVKMDYIL